MHRILYRGLCSLVHLLRLTILYHSLTNKSTLFIRSAKIFVDLSPSL
nr:MAG TPA: hypothetical protein [Caudoviricetes sp.]